MVTHLDKSSTFSEKVQVEVVMWPSNSTSRYIQEQIEDIPKHTKKKLYTDIHSSIIHKNIKSRNNPNVQQVWMERKRYVPIRKYSSMKRKEELSVLQHGCTLKIVCQVNADNSKYLICMMLFIWDVHKKQTNRKTKNNNNNAYQKLKREEMTSDLYWVQDIFLEQ